MSEMGGKGGNFTIKASTLGFQKNVGTWFNKVQLFWEGHKNLRNPPYGFDIFLVNVNTIRRIVVFSEKLNFNSTGGKSLW